MKVVAADNAFDMRKVVALLQDTNNEQCCEVVSLERFYPRYIGHVINIAVRKCLSAVNPNIGGITAVTNGLCSSMKQHELFENFFIKLSVKCAGMPDIYVEMRWPSTFKLILSIYDMRTFINAIASLISETSELLITEVD